MSIRMKNGWHLVWLICATVALAATLAGCSPQGQSNSEKSVFGGTGWVEHALMGKVYLLPENTSKLPDFKALKPVGTIYADRIDIPQRDWQEGFPGVTDRFEWFAIEYEGTFRVHTPGSYDFRLLSDDGAKLFIDGKLIIDNDGTHGPASQSGKVVLDDSPHSLSLQYFQGPRTGIALQLFYNVEGGKEQIFPGMDFELITPGGTQFPWWIGLVLLLVLVAGLAYWFSRKTKASEPESSPASIEGAGQSDVTGTS